MRIVRNLVRAPRAVGYWLGVGQKRALEKGEDIIFLCHGTPRRSAAWLERHLRYLRRVFTFEPLAELAASIGAARLPGRRRRAAMVFDDGLRSNVRVAYPILRALGIPATFFVCPGLIEERRWLWTHEARRRLRFAAPGLRRYYRAAVTCNAETRVDPHLMPDVHLPRGVLSLAWKLNHPQVH